MMAQQVWGKNTAAKETPEPSIEYKIQNLKQSVSEVYKYELLTTNQYLKQMELVLDIFNELSEILANQ
ncbi:hypothetical protein E4H04_10715 [Candidatus Bathyarchaeota archaeon]|nr:MAG: hypothetical protein E4H04_10715 [Candidatus Bathyarchaeota archaeon]